jgi:hypothetical protein
LYLKATSPVNYPQMGVVDGIGDDKNYKIPKNYSIPVKISYSHPIIVS